jgi:hypothetical protein
MSDPNWPGGSFPTRGDQGGTQDSSSDFPPNQGEVSPTFPPYGQPPTAYPYPYGQPGAPSQPLYPYGQPGMPPTMPPYPTEGGQAPTVDPSQPLYPYPYGQPGAASQPLYPYGQPGAPSTPLYPYGGYGPPSQGFPSAEVGPKKSYRGLIIGLIVGVLILALIGGGAVVGVNQYQAPANAAQQFCTALKGQDYVAAFALLSSQLQGQYTQAQFTTASQTLDQVEGNVTACGEAAGSAYNYTPFGSTATISSVITRAQSGPLSGTLHLVDNNGWKISGIDTSLLGVDLASLQAVASYCGALQQKDYTTAYSYLGSTLQSQVSQTAFSQQAALHEQVDGAVTGCTITGFGSGNNDTTTNLVVSITRSTLGQVSGALSLDLESGSWKITSVASTLEGTDIGGIYVVREFCAYIKADETTKAYHLTSSAFQSAVSLSSFDSVFGIAGITYGCTLQYSTYKVTDPTDAQISVDIKLSANGASDSVPIKFVLVKVGSTWKIDAFQ